MDFDIRKTRTCERCKAVVPLEKVRLYPKDKEKSWILCEACCEEYKNRMNSHSNFPSKIEKKPITNTVYLNRKEERVESDQRTLKKKFCSRCNYSFKVDPNKVGVLYRLCCPYCGKDDKVSNKS